MLKFKINYKDGYSEVYYCKELNSFYEYKKGREDYILSYQMIL